MRHEEGGEKHHRDRKGESEWACGVDESIHGRGFSVLDVNASVAPLAFAWTKRWTLRCAGSREMPSFSGRPPNDAVRLHTVSMRGRRFGGIGEITESGYANTPPPETG